MSSIDALPDPLASLSGANRSAVSEQSEKADFGGYLMGLEGDPAATATELLDLAQTFALAPISGFRVGAVAVGSSGHFYLGANMEFAGVPLSTSLHAEQSAVLNAWMHGEPSIETLAVSQEPCGHCRQFLNELSSAERLDIVVGGITATLAELLPRPFGEPHRLGRGLLDSPITALEPVRPESSRIEQLAANAARRSYAPYTRSHEGFILECTDGRMFAGRLAQSIAYNPSVPAVLTALNQRNLSGSRLFSISRCAHARLPTSPVSQVDLTQALIRNIGSAEIATVLMEPI